ncbi:MAG TPA: hypothetical protein VFL69_11825 [Marmoricola sp.]|nr:hypothetical protein [Marmoricola sp.]
MRPATLLKSGVALALLLGPLSVLTAPTATAADVPTYQTKIVWQMSKHLARYQQTFAVKAQVGFTPDDGAHWYLLNTGPDDGTVTLQRRLAGTRTWRNLGTADDPASVDFTGVVAQANATYRLRYSGGSYPDATAPSYTYAPSTSSTGSLRVMRRLGDYGKKAHGHLYVKGNVNPGWAHRTVTVQRRTCGSCKWKTYSRVQTSGTGAWSVQVKAPRTGSWYYRAYVPATTQYIKSWTTHVYRVYRF